MTEPSPTSVRWPWLGRISLALAIAPWVLVWWGPGVASFDRGWFLCDESQGIWMAGLPVALGFIIAGFVLAAVGLVVSSGSRAFVLAPVVSAACLVVAVVVFAEPLGWLIGMPTDSYCSDEKDPHGRRMHGLCGGDCPWEE